MTQPRRHDLIPVSRLQEFFDCDLDRGTLLWKKRPEVTTLWNHKYAGKLAGTVENTGYRRILLNRRRYLAHWIIFAMAMGRWPTDQLDHINNQRDDNRIGNLREATQHLNSGNRRRNKNHLLPKGVSVRKSPPYRNKLYNARINIDGKQKDLGYFQTAEETSQAYQAAALVVWGVFARGD